jgi:hypothetical protein
MARRAHYLRISAAGEGVTLTLFPLVSSVALLSRPYLAEEQPFFGSLKRTKVPVLHSLVPKFAMKSNYQKRRPFDQMPALDK